MWKVIEVKQLGFSGDFHTILRVWIADIAFCIFYNDSDQQPAALSYVAKLVISYMIFLLIIHFTMIYLFYRLLWLGAIAGRHSMSQNHKSVRRYTTYILTSTWSIPFVFQDKRFPERCYFIGKRQAWVSLYINFCRYSQPWLQPVYASSIAKKILH